MGKVRQRHPARHPEGGQALQRLMKGHQLWLHMGQVIRVTPKGRNSCKDNSSGTAFSPAETLQAVPLGLGNISMALLAKFPTDS